jgi:hypothetical protein
MPWNLLLKVGGSVYSKWSEKRAEKSAMSHNVAMEEMKSGNTRAKRKGSLYADLIIAFIVLSPYVIILVSPFTSNAMLVNASEFINTGINQIPNQLWILMYMVVGGNFGVSVSNIISNKKALK